MNIWEKLYMKAKEVQNQREISSYIEVGAVAAAILTAKGNIYTGVCIDTACSLGMCAERNAIGSMITAGENEVEKVAVIMPDGKAGMPCGACMELIMQLSYNSGEIEIIKDFESKEIVKMKDIMPHWWGKENI